jgi:hypothetical protein
MRLCAVQTINLLWFFSVNLRDFVTPCPSLQMLKETLMLEPAQRIVNRKPEIKRHIIRLGLG